MTIALTVTLALTVICAFIVIDRILKRHNKHVERLLQYQADPKLAALADMPATELLYLPPEDDAAWNKQHGHTDEAGN